MSTSLTVPEAGHMAKRQTMTLPTASHASGFSPYQLKQLIHAGRLNAIRVGSRELVLADSLEAIFAKKAAE